MKNKNGNSRAYIWVLPLILAAGLGIWRWRTVQATALRQPMQHDRYQCPMHPQIVEDHPGECPICHMRLEKVSEGDEAEGVGTEAGQHRIVKYRNPMNPAIFSDHAMKDSMGMDYIPVYADEMEGGAGVPGKASFILSPERQQLIGVRTTLVEMKKLVSTLRLPGRVLQGGRILAQLLEIDAGGVRVGMKARLQGPNGQEAEARVTEVEGSLDNLTHAFGVVLQSDSEATWMRPGVYSLVLIEAQKGMRLAIPDEAVLDTGERQVVFVARDKGSFEPRQVVLGSTGDDFVEVKEGLKVGEQVVTSANFLIDSESRFRAVLKNFDGASHD